MSSLDAALLGALRRSTVYFPRTELAELLRTDTATLTARVDELRAAGFEIDERPGLGYRLVNSPDRLIADDLLSRFGPSQFIRDVLVFAETDSTNQRAIELGNSGAAGGVAIFAEHQTAGRGRFGRRWESASKLGLWFSVLLRPRLPLESWSRLTTWAAVVTADAIEAVTGLSVAVKWPNDLEIAGSKVAGILIEMQADRVGGHFAVVGIGVNVNHTAEDFPEELRGRATSLRLASRRLIDRARLAASILETMSRRSDDFFDTRFAVLLAEASRRSSLLGKRVAIQTPGGPIEARAEGLAPDGRLLLRLDDGAIEVVGAGEASVLPGNHAQ
jgi:BirA family biotin operon repressor/biotin-[acetyl-CoA-carboxylase] ligase